MISIKKLNDGDTVHLLLNNGFPLKLLYSKTVGYRWEISPSPAGVKQSQETTTSFVGYVMGNDLGLATLYVQGSAGSDTRLTKGTLKGSGPAIVAKATIPWNYIKMGWKLTRVAIERTDPIIPSRPAFGTNVMRDRIRIP
jgi:hypothetical protein